MRRITYATAINEALHQNMQEDRRVFVIGQGVTSPWYVGNTCNGLFDKFGEGRVIDTPVSENAMTGVAVGSALNGMKPVLVFPRMDFMYYAMDQVANHAAAWHYMFGGQLSVPITIWGIINRGGGQAAQHAQAIHSIFAHLPGLKVVMPSSPRDVKGLLTASIHDANPVVFIDDRWLYDLEDEVPLKLFSVPIGEAAIVKEGTDITLVASSYAVVIAVEVAGLLAKQHIRAEIIDLRSVKPLDKKTILRSAGKTRRVAILDGGWDTGSIASDIAALVYDNLFTRLKGPVQRFTLPDIPAPASGKLEKAYYLNARHIARQLCFEQA